MKRRDFLTQTALAGVAGSVFGGGAPALASAPSRSANEKIRFACIGVGGKGDSDTNDAGEPRRDRRALRHRCPHPRQDGGQVSQSQEVL